LDIEGDPALMISTETIIGALAEQAKESMEGRAKRDWLTVVK
jgi:hypothetical protein